MPDVDTHYSATPTASACLSLGAFEVPEEQDDSDIIVPEPRPAVVVDIGANSNKLFSE